MEIEATVETINGCGLIVFTGSPVAGLFLRERVHIWHKECGIIKTGIDKGFATYDPTTERSLTVEYPVDSVSAKECVLPVGATGTIVVELDDAFGKLQNFSQQYVKVVYSKIVRGTVYHRFAWVEAPE